jgi:RHS repeat-associated protein
MKTQLRLAVLAMVAAAPVASAQPCPFPPPTQCIGPNCKCTPLNVGDPISMGYATGNHRRTDFKLPTTAGELEFARMFVSDPRAWGHWGSNGPSGYNNSNTLSGVPKPFGAGPGNKDGLRWWHSLYSMMGIGYAPVNLIVRDFDGYQREFKDTCAADGGTKPCWATRAFASENRLWLQDAGTTAEMQMNDGRRSFYTHKFKSTTTGYKFRFLSKVVGANGQTLLEISYADPGLGCQLGSNDSDTDTGVPYISSVKITPDASGNPSSTLNFNYTKKAHASGGDECIISSIQLTPPSGSPQTLVSYTYPTTNGSGKISQVLGTAGTELEAYDYGTAPDYFAVKHGAHEVLRQTYTSNKSAYSVSTLTGGAHGGFEPSFSSAVVENWHPCNTATSCCPATTYDGVGRYSGASWTNAKKGDKAGTAQTGASYVAWVVDWAGARPHQPEARYRFSTPTGAGAPPQAVDEYIFRSPDGGTSCTAALPGAPWGIKNARGNFTVTPNGWDTNVSPPFSWPAGTLRGATDALGAGALETTLNKPPTWTAAGVMRSGGAKRASIIASAGNSTETILKYATGYETTEPWATFTKGWSRNLAGAADSTPRYKALFKLESRQCGDTATDPFHRTLRVQGPCWVTDDTATNGRIPLTEFFYFDNTPSNGFKAGRLWKVVQYPENTAATGSTGCGTGLINEYLGYDALGNPTSVKYGATTADSSGVTTALTYEDGKIKTQSRVVSGSTETTTWNYENGNLISIQHPLGNYEVFCYRSGALSSCAGGTWTKQLQWKARASDALGANWSERVEYTYWEDGSLKLEAYKSPGEPGNKPRRSVFHAVDYVQRPTLDRFGTSSTDARVKRGFDLANNMTEVGQPFVQPPDFCKEGASRSTLCAWLTYDRANRLAQLDAHPTYNANAPSASSARTCLEYDAHGNIKRVATGCDGTGSACPINNSGSLHSSCSGTTTSYEWDDFGNLITVTAPWTSNASHAVTRFEFDASGNALKKQTEEMRSSSVYLQYTFDNLGRLLGVTREGGGNGNSITLYALGYDQDEAPASGCDGPARGNGRLTYRRDSFGATWYRYDEAGRVKKESRLREPFTSCGGSHSEDRSPSTSYTFDTNGNLTHVEYPHGRTVQYTYSQTNGANRISTVGHTSCSGSSCGGTYTNVAEDVRWEPFGGLRAYKSRFGTNTNDYHWVEYFEGAGQTTAPSSSTCSSLTTFDGSAHDESGRQRALVVSDYTASPGSPNGNVLKQVYTWDGDLLVRQDTCYANVNPVLREDFSYDNLQRLLTRSEVTVGSSTTMGYNRRGERSSMSLTNPSCTLGLEWAAGAHQVDLATAVKWGSAHGTSCNVANGKYSQTYDRDGRVTSISDSSSLYAMTFNYGQSDFYAAGIDSVYQDVTLAGGNYSTGSYHNHYDAFGRRRAKTTAWSSKEEYFHDVGNQLLSDTGGNTVGSTPTELPEDDYIWLDGRPVHYIRSRFDASTRLRTEGPANDCYRNGEAALCASVALVTDYLGKPVMALDRGNIAGTGVYQAFGAANRREARISAPHNTAGGPWTTALTPSFSTGFDGPVRVLLNRANYGDSTGTMKLEGVTQPLYGNRAHVWSNWIASASNTWVVSYETTSSADYGIDMEAYEFRMKKSGTTWAWTPLRFPGQYFDAESELHENWNRFYGPQWGRYLSPEPKLADAVFSVASAGAGQALASYAYGQNNPVVNSDPNGLYTVDGTCTTVPSRGLLRVTIGMIARSIARGVGENGSKDDCFARCVRENVEKMKIACNQNSLAECGHVNRRADRDPNETHALAYTAVRGLCDFDNPSMGWCERSNDPSCIAASIVHEAAHSCGWREADDTTGRFTGVPRSCLKR